MKKILRSSIPALAVALLLLLPVDVLAQIPSGYVQTTATVSSLANGTYAASWTNLSSSPQLALLGCVSTFQQTVNGNFDSNGHFSVLLADTAQICPTPSTWTFTLAFSCPSAPTGAFQVQVAVTGGGGTEDISSQIAAALPSNPCGGGSGGSVTYPGATAGAIPVVASAYPTTKLGNSGITQTGSGSSQVDTFPGTVTAGTTLPGLTAGVYVVDGATYASPAAAITACLASASSACTIDARGGLGSHTIGDVSPTKPLTILLGSFTDYTMGKVVLWHNFHMLGSGVLLTKVTCGAGSGGVNAPCFALPQTSNTLLVGDRIQDVTFLPASGATSEIGFDIDSHNLTLSGLENSVLDNVWFGQYLDEFPGGGVLLEGDVNGTNNSPIQANQFFNVQSNRGSGQLAPGFSIVGDVGNNSYYDLLVGADNWFDKTATCNFFMGNTLGTAGPYSNYIYHLLDQGGTCLGELAGGQGNTFFNTHIEGTQGLTNGWFATLGASQLENTVLADTFNTGSVTGGATNCAFTGSLSSNILTVSALSSCTLQLGNTITGSGVPSPAVIIAETSGTGGGIGTYQINNAATVSSESMAAAGEGYFINALSCGSLCAIKVNGTDGQPPILADPGQTDNALVVEGAPIQTTNVIPSKSAGVGILGTTLTIGNAAAGNTMNVSDASGTITNIAAQLAGGQTSNLLISAGPVTLLSTLQWGSNSYTYSCSGSGSSAYCTLTSSSSVSGFLEYMPVTLAGFPAGACAGFNGLAATVLGPGTTPSAPAPTTTSLSAATTAVTGSGSCASGTVTLASNLNLGGAPSQTYQSGQSLEVIALDGGSYQLIAQGQTGSKGMVGQLTLSNNGQPSTSTSEAHIDVDPVTDCVYFRNAVGAATEWAPARICEVVNGGIYYGQLNFQTAFYSAQGAETWVTGLSISDQVSTFPGTVAAGTLAINGDSAMTAAPRAFMPFATGQLAAIVSSGQYFVGQLAKAGTVENFTATAATLVCGTNPTLTLEDCGATAGTCSSPTAIASVTLTAANTVTSGTVSSATLTAGHFFTVETTAGVCTALNASGSAEYRMN